MRLHFSCRWCLSLMMLAASLTSFPQTWKSAMILLLDDDTTHVYPLDRSPKILLEDGKVIVVCGDMRTEYALNRIKGVRAGMAEVSGIDTTDSGKLSVAVYDDVLAVTGAHPGTQLMVYDVAGKSVLTGIIADDGTLGMDISHFAPGTYVIQAGAFSHKFIK